MKPDYYVKADGTVVMTYAIFRNLQPDRVTRMVAAPRQRNVTRKRERQIRLDVLLKP